MNKVNLKNVVAAILFMFLFAACSKKLMPPEISSSNDKIDSSDLTASNTKQPKDEPLGGNERAGATGDPDYFSEEPILESFSADNSSGVGGGTSDGPERSASATDKANEFAGSGGNGSGGKWGISPDGGNGSVLDNQIAQQNFKETANLKDIHFNFDQFRLDSNSKKVLKQNASYLKQNPGIKIEVQGHCDERGTNNYNIALGERRAHSTKRFLVSQGIDSSRINIISFGEEKPFCFESNEDCWFQNRRAHFMLAK